MVMEFIAGIREEKARLTAIKKKKTWKSIARKKGSVFPSKKKKKKKY